MQPQTGQLTGMEKQYFYDHAGRLIAEETTSTFYESAATTERIVFLYDESGIIGMRRTLNGTTSYYYFKRNLLGDVTAIYNSSGTMVAKYLYDAYGNCTYSGTTSIALANPIRYRGYYYDDETGLYYLNARYYSPMWRRFISPDDSEYLDPESINGLNQYCYCNNDPVNYCDQSGHSWESFWNGVGDWFLEHWAELAIGAGMIALGVLTMGAATLISGAGMAAALSTTGTAVASSLVQVGISTAISAGIGFAVGGLATGSWEGALEGMLDGIANGFMWGGIFAGCGQMLSGTMNITRSLAPNFNGTQIGKVKLWSPNSTNNPNAGGTLLKFGKFNRIDAEIGNMIHIHLKIWGHTFNHVPIGMIVGGLIGGF